MNYRVLIRYTITTNFPFFISTNDIPNGLRQIVPWAWYMQKMDLGLYSWFAFLETIRPVWGTRFFVWCLRSP